MLLRPFVSQPVHKHPGSFLHRHIRVFSCTDASGLQPASHDDQRREEREARSEPSANPGLASIKATLDRLTKRVH